MGSVDYVGASRPVVKKEAGAVEVGLSSGGIAGFRLEVFGSPQPVLRWDPGAGQKTGAVASPDESATTPYSKSMWRRYRTMSGPPSGTYRPPPPPEPDRTPGLWKGYGQMFSGDYESYDYGAYHAWLADRYNYQWSRDYSHHGPPDAHPRWRSHRKDVWIDDKEPSRVPLRQQVLETQDEIDRSYTYEWKRYLESSCRATPRGRDYSWLHESPRTATRQALMDHPATFLHRPRPKCIVVQGNEAYFTCAVEGSPEPTIEWLKEDQPIKIDGEKYKVNLAQGVCTLYVRECDVDDAGTYTAVVTNQLGSTSCNTVLQVAESTDDLWTQPDWCIMGGLVGKPMKKKEKKEEPPPPPPPEPEPEPPREPTPPPEPKEPKRTRSLFDENLRKEFVAKEREEARIEVTFTGDVPDEVVWEQMGKLVAESKTKGISFERDGNTFALVIKDATLKDAGEYTCVARDKWGTNKQAFRLTMKKGGVRKLAKPEWFLVPESISVAKGSSAKFYAEVDAAPAPTIDWIHKKKTLMGGGLYTIEHKGRVYKLEIGKVTEREAGDYKVVAHNSMGEISSDFKLELK
ncbi:myosin light chain kinase, smooth muscle-like [Branchiostoma floridae x Branchiostoma japonicum]